MAQKITLIEYNDDTYAGDDLDPDIQYRDFVPCVSGTKIVPAEPPADIEETARRIEDMRNYAYVISSSSYSSSFSSSSETPQEELFEHHETGGDDSYTIGQTSYSVTLAQTFTPDIAHQISRVELELFDNQGAGITGTITVEVKATDVNGLPTGDALATGTIDAADLEPSHMSDVYNDIYFNTGDSSYASDCYFSPDGTHLFVLMSDGSFNFVVYHYTMTVAFDISTATLSESVTMDEIEADWDTPGDNFYSAVYGGIYFKPDGSRMYIVGGDITSNAVIYQLDLYSNWSLADGLLYSGTSVFGYGAIYGLWFSSDGTKIFYSDPYYDDVYERSLSAAWDTTSTISASNSTDISSYTSDTRGVAFTSDGMTMMVVDKTNKKILFWNLSTAWTLSGESKDSYEMDISSSVSTPCGLWCSDDGKTLFVTDNSTNIYEFKMPAIRGDWHEADLGDGFELDAATKYALEATYDSYEAGVSEPEWVNNANGEDNYEAGTLLRYDGSNWFDS